MKVLSVHEFTVEQQACYVQGASVLNRDVASSASRNDFPMDIYNWMVSASIPWLKFFVRISVHFGKVLQATYSRPVNPMKPSYLL
jgi:hypothetical protein